MRRTLTIIALFLSLTTFAQESTTLTIYGMVPRSDNLDVVLEINGQRIHPAPLMKGHKLVHAISSTGKLLLVAKVTNTPGYRSAVLEIDARSGENRVITVTTFPGAQQGTGRVFINDISGNEKKVAKLEGKPENWQTFTSSEDASKPYLTR